MKQRTKKVLAGVGIGLILAVGSAIAIFQYQFGAQSTEELEAVANRFKPDPSWELEEEIINPPQKVCLDTSCNELYKRWRVNGIPTKEEMSYILSMSGWDTQIQGSCDLAGAMSGSGTEICGAEHKTNGYDISLSLIASPDKPTNSTVTLSVEGKFDNE